MMPKNEWNDAEYILILEATIDKLTQERDQAIAALAAAERRGMERAADCQPCTAENPNESAYQRARFDGIIEYARAIRAEMEKII